MTHGRKELWYFWEKCHKHVSVYCARRFQALGYFIRNPCQIVTFTLDLSSLAFLNILVLPSLTVDRVYVLIIYNILFYMRFKKFSLFYTCFKRTLIKRRFHKTANSSKLIVMKSVKNSNYIISAHLDLAKVKGLPQIQTYLKLKRDIRPKSGVIQLIVITWDS